jgi:general secretion pathway protein G
MKFIIGAFFIFSLAFLFPGPRIPPQPSKKEVITSNQILDLAQSIEMYYLDTKTFPLSSMGLTSLIQNSTDNQKWRGPYVKGSSIPIDSWGNNFLYKYPAKLGNETFDLYSFGKNRKNDFGGKDDITSWSGIPKSYYEES